MRRLVRWTIVTLGLAALVRWLRRRGEEPRESAFEATDDPAEELRRKLAETRGPAEHLPPAEPTAASVEDRRAEVHEHARAALSEMAPSDEE